MKKMSMVIVLLCLLPFASHAQQCSEDTQVARLSPAMMGSVPAGGGGTDTVELVANTQQSSDSGDNVTTATALDTFGSTVLIIIGLSQTNAATGVSDSKSNTWRSVEDYVYGAGHIQMWYSYDKAGGALSLTADGQPADHTFTMNITSSSYPTIFVIALKGTNTTSSVLVDYSGANDSGMNTGAVTPGTGDYIVAAVAATDSCPTISSGVNAFDAQTSSSYMMGRVGTITAPNTNDITAVFTGGGGDRPCIIAAFKAGTL